MAKRRRKRRATGRGTISRSLSGAQSALGDYMTSGRKYVSSGGRQASETIGAFLANFDTSELIAALKHKAASAVGAGGRKRKTAKRRGAKSATGARRKVAASRKKAPARRSARRK